MSSLAFHFETDLLESAGQPNQEKHDGTSNDQRASTTIERPMERTKSCRCIPITMLLVADWRMVAGSSYFYSKSGPYPAPHHYESGYSSLSSSPRLVAPENLLHTAGLSTSQVAYGRPTLSQQNYHLFDTSMTYFLVSEGSLYGSSIEITPGASGTPANALHNMLQIAKAKGADLHKLMLNILSAKSP